MGRLKGIHPVFLAILIVLLVFLLTAGTILTLQYIKLNEQFQTAQATSKDLQTQLSTVKSELDSTQKKFDEIAAEQEKLAAAKPTFGYQSEYLDLYAPFVGYLKETDSKTVYLTFDDGPSQNSTEILNILDKYDVKATFFTVCKNNAESKKLLVDIASRGHAIGVHSFTHVYRQIYSSVESYLDDFNKEYQLIYKTTGVKATTFRFPGGSINAYNHSIYQQIVAEMLRRGFVYYDWNVSSNDTTAGISAAKIESSILSQVRGKHKAIILMHDTDDKASTVKALSGTIESLKAQGYVFKTLDNSVSPIAFGYID